jgi:predicted small secreted protein
MKKSILLFVLFSAFVFNACNFSTGVKKDLGTGLSMSYNGFSVDEVVLAGPDNTAMRTNTVKLQTDVALVAQGLGNYTLKDEKAYPGLMLTVTDKTGIVILNGDDFFAGNDGYSPADASIIRGTVTIGDPMKSGETYHVKMRVWDKNKPETELVAEVDLVVE